MPADASDLGKLVSGPYVADANVGQRGALVTDESFHGLVVVALLKSALTKLRSRAEHGSTDGAVAA